MRSAAFLKSVPGRVGGSISSTPMGLLSDYARRQRRERLLARLPREARILEIGCGDGAVGRALKADGYVGYTGLDLAPPADLVGSITDWRQLGLAPGAFDAVIAFEVVEHVPCFREAFDLLKPGGLFILTTPVPHWDWACRILEALGVNQKRTSPHDHLVYVEDIPYFEPVENFRFLVLSQMAVLRKAAGP